MNIHHIRNATAILDYGGKKFLIDPMLAEKGTLPPFISYYEKTQFLNLYNWLKQKANMAEEKS